VSRTLIVTANIKLQAVEKLFEITEEYLERSGGVALQYFKAASRVLKIANETAFERWTALAKQVALQGNAASYHFMKSSPQIIADLGARFDSQRRAQVVSAVLEIVEEIADKNTTAAVEPASRKRAATSSPFIPGIEMSSTMTSGLRVRAASRAARPSLADPTTTQQRFSTAAERTSIASLSSTRRTRADSDDVVLDGILYELGDGLHLELFHHPAFVEGHGSW